ncbi:MAG: sulfatase [Planctomycetota bacterium]
MSPSRALCFAFLVTVCGVPASADDRPNVLFIAVDDLNHWVGYTGRNGQTLTPNIDRLSETGVSFTNAHCAAPACEPSRAALMSGLRPSTSACYKNGDNWRELIPRGYSLNAAFKNAGYHVAGMGKIYHSSSGGLDKNFADEWSEYPAVPRGSQSGRAKKNWGYHEELPLDMADDDIADYHSVGYFVDKLNEEREEPLFLAVGLIKPHLPWAVPRKYYDRFPLEEIELPPTRDDDMSDVPLAGRKTGIRTDHPQFLKSGRWDDAVQSYLATISYVDGQIGRLLDGLAASPRAENTIVVLWGDHGWHLGEKQRWRKFTLWEEATRVPLIVSAPGVTPAGTLCDRPVDLMGLFPTLCDLSGVETPGHVEGDSWVPLLNDPNAAWDGVALTTDGRGRHAVRDGRWRLIRYQDGSQELYDHDADEYEWTNLADDPAHADVIAELACRLPDPASEAPASARQKKGTKAGKNGAGSK